MYKHVNVDDGLLWYPVDAQTGEPIPHVKWADTDTGELGRYQVDEDGTVEVNKLGELIVFAEKHDFNLKDSRVDPFPDGCESPPMRKVRCRSKGGIQRLSKAAWHP